MGQRQGVFEEAHLEQYQECSYFTKEEIVRLYERFSALNPDKISPKRANVATRLSFTEVQDLPELRENPFKERMCEVFSTGNRGLHFEDFLDMFSVFSERAPWDLKATYAFRIFDFNNDAAICRSDIQQILKCLTGRHTLTSPLPCTHAHTHPTHPQLSVRTQPSNSRAHSLYHSVLSLCLTGSFACIRNL